MKYDVELYIQGKLVEFSSDPKILLNYKETELHNPTIVKNSFSKSIEVEGTSGNNDIFNHIWNLDRYQYYSTSGDTFNPIQKAEFQLFINGELFEKGYAKLDKIDRSNNQIIKYYITLYGGLGDFFYNLSYDGNTKKSLASLQYSTPETLAPDLSFDINKDTVYQAWGQLTGTGDGVARDKWKVINFIPAYNGLPDDFDSAKVLINNKDLDRDIYLKSKTEGGAVYTPFINGVGNQDGYSLGDLPEDMTEWETYDLRSYNQRPAINFQRVIQACCEPENNGGYKVELDSHFFNANNPYYQSAWMTLPMLKSLESSKVDEVITGATVTRGTWAVNFNSQSISTINNVSLRMGLRFTPQNTSTAQNLYSARHYHSNTTTTLQGNTFVRDFDYSGGIIVQLQAFSGSTLVGASKAYLLSTEKNYPNSLTPLYDDFWMEGEPGTKPEYEYIQGHWAKSGNTYVFVDENGRDVSIDFNLSNNTNFTRLEFKVKDIYQRKVVYAFTGNYSYRDTNTSGFFTMYTGVTYNTTGNARLNDVLNLGAVSGFFDLDVKAFSALASSVEGLFSNTHITKEMLLSGEHTPADYLLSYCKLFGLYFYCDSTEEADDTVKYPSGVIHIMDRDTFYTEEYVDLSKLIDFSKKLTITPSLANAKWYKFDLEQVESQAEDDYMKAYKFSYGTQLVDTNYNFDNNTTDLYDGNAFRGGIMVREKDKYYKQPVQGVPNYTFNGLTYQLFALDGNELNSIEIEQDVSPTNNWSNINTFGLDGYDCFPKLQLHTSENSASDGSNVLVFLNGTVSTDGERGKTNYWLTDDVYDMVMLNDGTACYILTASEYDANDNRIAYRINYFPYFTRELVYGGQEGNIINSWNFGHPQVTFVPNTFTTYGDSIYDKCWKAYISDLYDVNTSKLNCYVNVHMDGKPWPYWLRRYYWFENSLWRLNTISDLNMASYETTKMEFIKVQDIENYKLDQITYNGNANLIFNKDKMLASGGTMTGKVVLQNQGTWRFNDTFSVVDYEGHTHTYSTSQYISPTSGSGAETNFTMTVPANQGLPRTWNLCFINTGEYYCGSFIQDSTGEGYLTITPSAMTVSYNTLSVDATLDYMNVWESSMVISNASWARGTISGNTLHIALEANLGDSARTYLIQVECEDYAGNEIIATLFLTQNANTIEVSPTTLIFDYNSTTAKTLTITTDTNWTITDESL